MKSCTKCKIKKPLVQFHKNTASKDKHFHWCKHCVCSQKKEYYNSNTEEIKLRVKKYRENNTEKISKRAKDYDKNHRPKNPESRKKAYSKYAKTYPDKINAKTAKRRAAKRQSIPLSLTVEQYKQIKLWYTRASEIKKFTGEIWHVDHIVPIRGEFVSGLHVPWNLQLLPASENCAKGNRINLFQ